MERMAVEGLVASLWQLEDFFTRTRVPVKVPGGYSDVDVVGVDADGHVRLAECKVRGPARWVGVVNGDFTDWLDDRSWGGSLANVERLWEEMPQWLPYRRQTASLEFWFVANVWFPDPATHAASERSFTNLVRASAPHGLRAKTTGRILTTRDLILSSIQEVRAKSEEDWGRRYGDPVLDVLRELVRYSKPKPGGGGRRARSLIAAETGPMLLQALGLDPLPGAAAD